MTDADVYLVPYMDGAWAGYDPLSAEVGFSAPPFSLREVTDNLRRANDLMGETADGRFVFGVHTGVYCRHGFYAPPLLELYADLIAAGGELAVHPHEELVTQGTLVASTPHMEKIITDKTADLREAGLNPTSYRGGYCAYAPALTAMLEKAGIYIDLSAAPGQHNPTWSEYWENALPSAYYLCSDDPFHGDCGHARSQVLEIPMGWDGRGASWAENYLNEDSTLESMKATWQTILDRREVTGRPQIVYFMTHVFAVSDPKLYERCVGILNHAKENGGAIVTPSEAKAVVDGVAVGSSDGL